MIDEAEARFDVGSVKVVFEELTVRVNGKGNGTASCHICLIILVGV
jgi:hypothetical protein